MNTNTLQINSDNTIDAIIDRFTLSTHSIAPMLTFMMDRFNREPSLAKDLEYSRILLNREFKCYLHWKKFNESPQVQHDNSYIAITNQNYTRWAEDQLEDSGLSVEDFNVALRKYLRSLVDIRKPYFYELSGHPFEEWITYLPDIHQFDNDPIDGVAYGTAFLITVPNDMVINSDNSDIPDPKAICVGFLMEWLSNQTSEKKPVYTLS